MYILAVRYPGMKEQVAREINVEVRTDHWCIPSREAVRSETSDRRRGKFSDFEMRARPVFSFPDEVDPGQPKSPDENYGASKQFLSGRQLSESYVG